MPITGNKILKKLTPSLSLGFLIASLLPGSPVLAAGNPVLASDTAIYCMEDKEDYTFAFFSQVPQPDGNLIFSMNVFNEYGAYFAYGPARKVSANHWRYTYTDPDAVTTIDMQCTIDIKRSGKDWTLVADEKTSCSANRGERAPKQAPAFKADSYIGPVPADVINGPAEARSGDNLQIMANWGSKSCSKYKEPYKAPYSTTP